MTDQNARQNRSWDQAIASLEAMDPADLAALMPGTATGKLVQDFPELGAVEFQDHQIPGPGGGPIPGRSYRVPGATCSRPGAGPTTRPRRSGRSRSNGDVSGQPPVYILNAEADRLRASGEAYAEQLRAAGVRVEVEFEPGTQHGHVNEPYSPGGQRSIDRMARWLGAASGGAVGGTGT